MDLTTKMCLHCGILKSLSKFGVRRRALDGRRAECRACRRLYEKALREKDTKYRERQKENSCKWGKTHKQWKKNYGKEYRKNNPERCKVLGRKGTLRKYGLTEKNFDRMLREQKDKCLICECTQKSAAESFCVDHSHVSGNIRGLLCRRCNMQLAFPEKYLDKIIKYLERYSDGN